MSMSVSYFCKGRVSVGVHEDRSLRVNINYIYTRWCRRAAGELSCVSQLQTVDIGSRKYAIRICAPIMRFLCHVIEGEDEVMRLSTYTTMLEMPC